MMAADGDPVGSEEGLTSYRISGFPDGFYYISQFITEQEEETIMSKASIASYLLRANVHR